jgi:hypothetical protein
MRYGTEGYWFKQKGLVELWRKKTKNEFPQ